MPPNTRDMSRYVTSMCTIICALDGGCGSGQQQACLDAAQCRLRGTEAIQALHVECPADGRAKPPMLHTTLQLTRCFNCNPKITRLLAVLQHAQHTIAPCHPR